MQTTIMVHIRSKDVIMRYRSLRAHNAIVQRTEHIEDVEFSFTDTNSV